MAGNEPSRLRVVCDAGPLIHLHELGCLDLLTDFAAVLVPESVWREVERHRPEALAIREVTLERVSPAQAEPPELETLARLLTLHQGERDALRVARGRKAGLFFTDDTAARLAAGNLGLPAHGTVGLIARAIRRGQRTKGQVLGILRAIPTASTLHLKRSLLDTIIAEVEKS